MRIKIILLIMIFSLFLATTYAHPGRTDSSGCHYCRTNCAKYGLETGEYHCHNSPKSTSTTSPTPTPANVSTDRMATVTSIVDGDTIYIDYKEKIRFVGINIPEIGQKGSLEAKQYVSDKIMNKQIYLDVDNKNFKDQYGRTLAVVFIEGENLNKELLCEGYAEVMYIPPSEFNPNQWKSSCSEKISIKSDTLTTTPLKPKSSSETKDSTITKEILSSKSSLGFEFDILIIIFAFVYIMMKKYKVKIK